MPNNFITAHQVAMEALERLDATAVLANNCYRDYEQEFRNTGDTITVRVPAVLDAATEFDQATGVVPEDLKETSVDLKLSHHYDKTVSVTSRDRTLSITNFNEQILNPMMESIVNRLELDMSALSVQTHQIVKGSGATNTQVALPDLTKCRTILGNNHFPFSNRNAVLTSEAAGDLLDGSTFNNGQSAADGGRALREAELGRVRGFNTMETVYGYTHVKGTGVAAKATGALGATTITLTGTSGTIKVGDILTITGVPGTYVALKDVAALSAVASSLDIYPGLAAAAAAADTTLGGDGSTSLVYYRNAILLATRPLALPLNATPENASIANYKGLSVRVVFWYDGSKKTDCISIDMLAGMTVARRTGLVRLTRPA